MYREYRNNNNNEKHRRLLLKTAVCISGILALLFVAFTYKNYRLKEGNAPYVHVKEVLPFMETLTEVNKGIISQEMQNDLLGLQNRFMMQQNEEESYLLFGELQTILRAFPIESVDWLTEYKGESWYVGLRDWNRVAELLTQNYGNGRIVLQELSLLGMSEQISDEEHNAIAENMVFTGKNLLHNQYPCIGDYLFSNVNAICFEDSILSITGHAKEKGILENVYFSDISEDRVHLFYNGYHMYYPVDTFNNISGKYENGKNLRKIIDIELEKGSMNVVHEKEDYIHGKLLQVSDSTIEIEGYGKYQTDENMQVYKEYGELESVNKNDLRIGYPFSDFVVEDGKIVACLVIKDEDMEYIRVLLKNSDMAGRYHENVSGYCNRDMEWIEYEEGVEKERRVIPKGENFNIDRKDIKRSGKRIKLIPSVLSGEITLESVNRSNGNPSYLGSLEITGDEEGLLVINEVLLEDYLCKVVPSEMPSSYPKEALMAQAVCARTYAYGKMMNAGLPEFGAHVDDSAGFQVYNNIAEQTSTTEAVKATHNIIAQYNGEPIGAYYYSTSCGMGSDTGVWHGASVSPGYLQAKEIGIQQDVDGVLFSDAEFTPQSLMDEEVFEKAEEILPDENVKRILDELREIYCDIAEICGNEGNITVDLGLVNKTDYYTGLIIKGYLKGHGEEVISGGRYDKLISDFGYDIPAVGFAVNVNAISKVIERNGILPTEPSPDVIVYAEEGCEAAAIKQARELREQGFIVENALFSDIESVREYAKEKRIGKVVVVDCDSEEDEI